jgi:hypothetical protein
VAILANVFVLAVATPLAGPPFAVTGVEGVFGFLASLTAQGGVDDEEKQADLGLLLQEVLPQDRVDLEFPPTWPRQETAELSPMSSLTANGPSGTQAGHSASMQQESDDHADHEKPGALRQSDRREELLEPRNRIGEDDHGEAHHTAGEISRIWPL